MNPFPQDWELLALFEVEPTLADVGTPWYYNTLTFETTRGDFSVRCEIEPSYENIRLQCWHHDTEVISLDLHWVGSMQVHTGEGKDFFVAKFRNSGTLPLEFYLKPSVQLRWGTSHIPP